MQYAITGVGDRHVCVWDTRSGVRRATLRCHRRGVTSLATLAQDAWAGAARPHANLQCLLVSGGADCEIRCALLCLCLFPRALMCSVVSFGKYTRTRPLELALALAHPLFTSAP